MVISFVTGIFLALGQHFLYRSLNHKAYDSEDKKARVVLYGRALAYSCKVAFGGCVILCYRQRIWRTFRERALSVFTIDQLFLATEDPSLFLNWETITKATIVTAMALVLWVIPIATIVLSPAALTFGDFLELGTNNVGVPTLNFTAESFKDWRKRMVMPDGSTKKSLTYWNTTDRDAKTPGWYDYYDQPSADLKRIALMAAYNLKNQTLNRDDARIKSCGGDFNCTYAISFVAPGYNCVEIATGSNDDQKLHEAGAPFDTSALVPRGQNVYLASVDNGDYQRPQPAEFLSNQGGVPSGYIPDDFGFFKSEPVLWIGYSTNSTEPLPDDSPFRQNWTHRFDPHVFSCTHYETNYTVTFNYSGPFFTTHVSSEFLSPVVDTNFSRFDNGTINYNDPGPASNFLTPHLDVPKYKKVAAYHAMGKYLRDFLRGSMELVPPSPVGPSYAKVYSDITITKLVSNSTNEPLDDLPKRVQGLYTDMILSLFSAPQLLVVSEERMDVKTSKYKSTFMYTAPKLWACYIPVIFFVFVILLFGAFTIWEDGTTFGVGFSRIMVTTRNTTLDEISRGACLGNDPFPVELMQTRLKFGVLNEGGHELEYMGIEGSGVGHCAFGVPSELSPIHRGVRYAGLQRRSEGVKKMKED
ncbi:hypothetical protein K491DRAFT_597386 [Lophiostoma macrostomum CBS 122681]|uniref:Uncharacterized protein n=1 Tax=Lophiostoma macrostomum CBS 122681 TaxID=1314788 RepID=A0A6A6T850_9PLEO|nr:hypothetical protein K491DRAFT_597386 [Lophiostoma macrostomum CBS 122681]